jgi:hypothetical protein
MLTSQSSNKLLVRLRLRPAQLVIEMDDGENDAEFLPQFEQKTEERYRIDAARNGYADAIARVKQLLPANVKKHAVCEGVHRHMVTHCQAGTGLAQGGCGASTFRIG